MEQLNVYGCRGYLVSVASNHIFQLLFTVIIRAPFEYTMIQFRDSEPSTLRFICTTSDSLCLMVPLIYSFVHLQNKQQTYSPKFFVKRHSKILKSLQGITKFCFSCPWLQGILGECGFESQFSTIIYCDNQSTIRICNDLVQIQ